MNSFNHAEITHSCQAQLFIIGNNVANNNLSIEEIGDYLPGSVMVQDLGLMTNTYMNKFGCEFLQSSKEDLELMGSEYFSKFFPSDEMAFLKNEIYNFVSEADTNKVHSFFQRVRPNEKEDYSWYFTTSRLYPAESNFQSHKLIHVAIQVNMLSYVGRKLNNIVDEDVFVRKNLRLFNLLSVREKQIIKLIVEGKSSVDIADLLCLSIHTVNNHRKNILYKLEINCLTALIKFALSFGIVDYR